jgi:hypothetical protein
MRGLSRTSSEPTFRMLPCHDLVNHPLHVINPSKRQLKSSNSPLLVARIQPNLQHAEPLHRPKQQPRLTRVLADVSRWKSLDKVPYKELHVSILLESWPRCSCQCWIWDMFQQHLFGLRLRLGCGCRKPVYRCWMSLHDDFPAITVAVLGRYCLG